MRYNRMKIDEGRWSATIDEGRGAKKKCQTYMLAHVGLA